MDFDREIDYLLTSSLCKMCKIFRGQDSYVFSFSLNDFLSEQDL